MLASVKVGGVHEDWIIAVENLIGGSGGDTLIGDGLSNTLNGYLGNATLNGGAGHDKLIGGLGNDTFVFRHSEAGGDTIFDFAGNGATTGDQIRFEGMILQRRGLASYGLMRPTGR